MTEEITQVGVMGCGAWGTVLANLLVAQGCRVDCWSRHDDRPLSAVVANADILVSAVSMSGVGAIATLLQGCSIPAQAILVTTTKGLTTLQGEQGLQLATPALLWQQALPNHSVVVLSGPNLSEEIRQGLPAATVVASVDSDAATRVQSLLSSRRFRVYTNSDPKGVELGGTLKNVIAIAAGACDGLHLGTNAKSALVTRGLAEMIRLGCHWGARPETFYGLSGLGDLLATCNSPLSRNYQVGYRLAQGASLAAVLADLKGTAEGVNTTRVLVAVARQQGISLPIAEQVAQLLNQEITAQAAVAALMQRDMKSEW